MNPGLLLNNLALYSLQIGLLVGLAAFVPGALRLRLPAAKLAYWQLLLAACLALPLVAPWRPPAATITLNSAPAAVRIAPGAAAAHVAPPFTQTEILLAIFAAGILARLAWLAIGFWRLRRYRRNSEPVVAQGCWSAPLAWGVEADLRISEGISSPVTFGLFKPVVLLPANFHEMPASAQEAILAHECVHVRRKDWSFTLVEEMIRALFWFHPAIWWLLGEIDLAREQEVDRRAVEITKGREEYVDALLAVAGARPALDLAPAPPFLRKRRLKHRVVAILKQAAESKRRVASALAAAVCLMATACWIAAGAFPLVAAPKPVAIAASPVQVTPPAALPASAAAVAAPPQQHSAQAIRTQRLESDTRPVAQAPSPEPPDGQPESAPPAGVIEGSPGSALAQGPGEIGPAAPRIKVGGNVQMANVASRVPVQYSALARQARIQDHVILRVIVGTDGAVRDVKVVSGHPLLRQAALDAVKQWRYKPTMLNGAPVEVETDVDVNFSLDQ